MSKHDVYTDAPPAVIGLLAACLRLGHADSSRIVDVLRKDKRKWSQPLRYELAGLLDEGTRDNSKRSLAAAKAIAADVMLPEKARARILEVASETRV